MLEVLGWVFALLLGVLAGRVALTTTIVLCCVADLKASSWSCGQQRSQTCVAK